MENDNAKDETLGVGRTERKSQHEPHPQGSGRTNTFVSRIENQPFGIGGSDWERRDFVDLCRRNAPGEATRQLLADTRQQLIETQEKIKQLNNHIAQLEDALSEIERLV